MKFCNLASLLQLHFFKTSQFGIGCFYETSCKFGQGNGAIAAHWQAKAGVEPPFAGCERPFSLRTMIANHEPQANKSFLLQQFFKNAGEVWASSPHLRSKFNFVVWFFCCNCIF